MNASTKGKDTVKTRRTKRRADEVEKPSSGTPRKRQAAKKADNNPTRPNVSREASKSSKKQPSARRSVNRNKSQACNNDLNDVDRKQFNMLLKKANLPNDLLTEVTAKMIDSEAHRHESSNSDQRPCEEEELAPSDTTVSIRTRSTRTVSARKSGRRQVPDIEDENENEEERVHELDKLTEFEAEQQEHEGDEFEDRDEEDDGDDPIDSTTQLNSTVLSKIGESDDEQEVSFHDGLTNTIDQPSNLSAPQSNDDHLEGHEVNENNEVSNKEDDTLQDGDALMKITTTDGVDGADSSVVINVAQSIRKYILSEMQTSFQKVFHELRADRDQMRRLQEHVSELTAVVTATASSMFIKNASSQPRMKEIHGKLCLLPAIFSDKIMLMIVPRVVIAFFVRSVENGSTYSMIEQKGVQFLSVLYFSKKPNETKKEKFTSEVGKVYSKFRFSLLTTSILAMQENSFHSFRNDNFVNLVNGVPAPIESVDNEESSTIGPSVTAMPQPFWLKPGYILEHHCTSAANKQEKRGGPEGGEKRGVNEVGEESQSVGDLASQPSGDTESIDNHESSQSSGKAKISKSGPLTQNEIATEAACLVYKIITAVLYRSRAASKIQLFNDLTYLFTGWRQHGATVDQNKLKIRWETSNTKSIDFMDDLPRTRTVRPNERRFDLGNDVDKIDQSNTVLLERLIANHPELSLIIEHNVLVAGTERLLKYRLSLIEVTCRLLSAYITLESASKSKQALSVDKRCFTVIMIMAMGLRKLMEKAISDMQSTSVVPWSENRITDGIGKRGRPRRSCTTTAANQNAATSDDSGTTKYQFMIVNGISLNDLQPARSKQKELLNHMILNLTQEEFNIKSMNSNLREIGDNTDPTNQSGRLQADESQYVFRF